MKYLSQSIKYYQSIDGLTSTQHIKPKVSSYQCRQSRRKVEAFPS